MEWWRLFSGTFILIFLAELGDKTQLAAMAKTADSPDNSMAKWVVFAGASLALVASTFIAVFLGHILKSIVPDERYIRLAAAVLFLIFGSSILYETIASFRAGTEKAAVLTESQTLDKDMGVVGGLALKAAVEFEELTRERYARLAKNAGPDLSALLLQLSQEEESHLIHLHEFTEKEQKDAVWNTEYPVQDTGISYRQTNVSAADQKTLASLIESEEATAAFYRTLALRTHIPSVRAVLLHLANEEANHAERLRNFRITRNSLA